MWLFIKCYFFPLYTLHFMFYYCANKHFSKCSHFSVQDNKLYFSKVMGMESAISKSGRTWDMRHFHRGPVPGARASLNQWQRQTPLCLKRGWIWSVWLSARPGTVLEIWALGRRMSVAVLQVKKSSGSSVNTGSSGKSGKKRLTFERPFEPLVDGVSSLGAKRSRSPRGYRGADVWRGGGFGRVVPPHCGEDPSAPPSLSLNILSSCRGGERVFHTSTL